LHDEYEQAVFRIFDESNRSLPRSASCNFCSFAPRTRNAQFTATHSW